MNAETCFAYNHHWIISGMGYWEELGKNCIRNRRSLGMKEASLRDSPINNCQVNVCTVIIEYSRDSNIQKNKKWEYWWVPNFHFENTETFLYCHYRKISFFFFRKHRSMKTVISNYLQSKVYIFLQNQKYLNKKLICHIQKSIFSIKNDSIHLIIHLIERFIYFFYFEFIQVTYIPTQSFLSNIR